MLRKILTMLALTLITTGGVAVVTATSADAAVVGCATRTEFRQIHPGQSVRTTQSIIGGTGKVSIGGSFLSQRQWKVCGSPYSWVTLTYVQGRLDNKIML